MGRAVPYSPALPRIVGTAAGDAAPPFATALPDTPLTRAMTRHLRALGHASDAEALQRLRRAFPDSPLSMRVAALAALGKR